jgi:HSP20 family molecular chaperone IbpA
MQTAQPRTAGTEALRLSKKAVQRESARRTKIEGCDGEPIAIGASLPPISVSETESGLCVWVPLHGVDARHIYVLASPHAITIEILIKHTVPHSGIVYKEYQHQCITRALQLHSAIKEGSTSVRMGTNRLEIRCSEESATTERTWSEFIQFNTRGSLGCV